MRLFLFKSIQQFCLSLVQLYRVFCIRKNLSHFLWRRPKCINILKIRIYASNYSKCSKCIHHLQSKSTTRRPSTSPHIWGPGLQGVQLTKHMGKEWGSQGLRPGHIGSECGLSATTPGYWNIRKIIWKSTFPANTFVNSRVLPLRRCSE